MLRTRLFACTTCGVFSFRNNGCCVPLGLPREQKMLQGHLPRVIYHQVYYCTKIKSPNFEPEILKMDTLRNSVVFGSMIYTISIPDSPDETLHTRCSRRISSWSSNWVTSTASALSTRRCSNATPPTARQIPPRKLPGKCYPENWKGNTLHGL